MISKKIGSAVAIVGALWVFAGVDFAQGFGRPRPIPSPTPTESPTPTPSYNVGIEIFENGPGQGPLIPGATVDFAGERRQANEQGYITYYLPAGDYPLHIEAAGYEPLDTTLRVVEDRNFQVGLRRVPPQHVNFVIEVFNGPVAGRKRVQGASVFVDQDTRTSDGNGFTHFWAPVGSRAIRVEANGFKTFTTQYVIDREHTGTYPSTDRPSFRVELQENAKPYCTSRTVNDSNAGVPKALPNVKAVIDRVHAANPRLIQESCKEHGGNNNFLFAVIAELRKTDPRWGLNWKRGNIGDMSQDVINYYRGTGPFADGTDTYVIDIIGGHCGPNPQPAWIDVTGVGGALARWTIDPAPKCP